MQLFNGSFHRFRIWALTGESN
jgi:hypothetical protein